VRPSQVVTHNGWDAYRVRSSQPSVASLGANLVTETFKRRQASQRAESRKVEGIEPRNMTN